MLIGVKIKNARPLVTSPSSDRLSPMANGINDDVLRLIFEDFTCGEPWKWPDAVYDQERARGPFLLAAVSRRWRNLALDTAALWSYFGFPGDAVLYPKHVERLRVLLEASKNIPVDINVTLGTPYDYEGRMLTQSTRLGAGILETLGSLGPRWRNVRFRLPSEATAHLRPALQKLMPNLVSLSAVTGVKWNILPLAPRLERLYVEWVQFNGGPNMTAPRWQYPAMTSFAVMGESLVLALSTQNFSDLTDVCFMHNMNDLPKSPLQFPQLLSLVLEDPRFMSFIQAPRLAQLGVNGSRRFDFPQPLPDFPTVESLIIFGEAADDLAKGLWALSSIRTLNFHTPISIQTCFVREPEYSASALFFHSLNEDPRGLTWPQLRQIHFKQPNRDGAIAECHNDSLLEFVRKRNTDYALAQRAERIDEIILDHPNVMQQETAETLAELSTLRRTYYFADSE